MGEKGTLVTSSLLDVMDIMFLPAWVSVLTFPQMMACPLELQAEVFPTRSSSCLCLGHFMTATEMKAQHSPCNKHHCELHVPTRKGTQAGSVLWDQATAQRGWRLYTLPVLCETRKLSQGAAMAQQWKYKGKGGIRKNREVKIFKAQSFPDHVGWRRGVGRRWISSFLLLMSG